MKPLTVRRLCSTLCVLGVVLAPMSSQAQSEPTVTPEKLRAVLQDFGGDVQAAMETFYVEGAAVAVFRGDEIVFNRGFGVRDLQSQAPVTPHTRFRIGSNTKSMSSLMLATLVEEGLLEWDARAVDIWPDFRAPTPELTRQLRVRDLLGMGSGLAESPTIEFFMSGGDESGLDLLRSVSYLPVIAPPDTTYYYNNTLVAAAAFLGPLVQGRALGELEEAYAALIQERVFGPIGMADAAIASDPRALGDDYATGYTRDISGELSPVPFISIAGAGPAGAGLASTTDMARYLITQMNGGVTPEGTRVVSEAILAETHRAGILIKPGQFFPPQFQPDTASLHYGMGWFHETFDDGRHLIWHAGGIDGFASLMGFFPEDKLGFVILTNLEPNSGGSVFSFYLQDKLMDQLFGLNGGVPDLLSTGASTLEEQMAALASQAEPVDPTTVTPYLGLYGNGFRLRLDAQRSLRLEHDIRSMPLLALPDGNYIVADGPGIVMGKKVSFSKAAGGVPTMTIEGFEPVTWLTGG